MQLETAKKVAQLIDDLKCIDNLIGAVEKKTAHWTEFSFKGEDGSETENSIRFGGITPLRS